MGGVDYGGAPRLQASEVALDPPVNGANTVQDALNGQAGDAWIVPDIPTADPMVAGQIWADSGVLTVSAG